MIVQGTFTVHMEPEPPFDEVDGVTLNRATFAKRFTGPLDATSTVQMLAARTPEPRSAGYVAIERIVGTLEGRTGSFVVVQLGIMDRDAQSLTVTIVPDSGTGELKGVRGSMDIQIRDGAHHYILDAQLP